MSTSSLSRAFTTRRAKPSTDLGDSSRMVHRSNTTSRAPQNLRHKISAPVQLVSTTNMLSYNAPDLPRAGLSEIVITDNYSAFELPRHGQSDQKTMQPHDAPTPTRSARSDTIHSKSDEESDVPHTAGSTPPTSPDVAPGEHSPSMDKNHLSTYFVAPDRPMTSATAAMLDVPAIPKRSPSHTKKNSYDAIARQRSMSRLSKDSELSLSTKASSTFSRSSSTSTNASLGSRSSHTRQQKQSAPPMPSTMLVPPPRPARVDSRPSTAHNDSHPFGQELAQVTELAEEYGVKSHLKVLDEDEQYLEKRGLARWSPSDYLSEIQALSASFFPESLSIKPAPLWI